MNQVYKKKNYVIIPVGENYVVINTEKVFKNGHTHVKKMGVARLLIDLAIRKELPRNPYYIDSLVRLTNDKKYIKDLKEFEEDTEEINYKRMMEDVPVCRRVNGAIRRIR